MKLGVVGSRRRNTPQDKELIKNYILEVQPTELVSGGCAKGADKFAEELSVELNIPIKIFYPQITKNMNYYERIDAYFARNYQIAEYSHAVLALVASDRKGGTENTIKHCKKLNRTTIII